MGEGGRGLLGPSPAPRPYKYGFPGSLWGRELGGEPRAASALPTPLAVGLSPEGGPANAQFPHSAARSLPAAPVRARDILTRDAVTVFKSQGRGSASPRTSCLYISPFTGEYPAPSAGISLAAVAAGTPRLLVPAPARGRRGTSPSPCRSQRQGCKGGGGGTEVLRASRQRK